MTTHYLKISIIGLALLGVFSVPVIADFGSADSGQFSLDLLTVPDPPGETLGWADSPSFCLDCGDCDCDGDVDLSDFLTFQTCYTGPGGGPVGIECECADFDGDGDVDLTDFLAFQTAYTGPGGGEKDEG